ncbi:MAG: hypothetical protein WCE79_26830 [Xanthobacteraceae bacterium]
MPVTRRNLLTGTASLAAAALAPAAPLARPTQEPDGELTALGRRFEQARGVHEAAQRAFNDCERRYLQDCPDPPDSLTSAGALGAFLRHKDSWWSARELRGLLRDDERRAEWPAAQAALRVALAYEARERRFKRKLGLRQAERAYHAATHALDDLATLILAEPAHSGAGLAVKARATKLWGKPEWWSEQASHADPYERFAAQILDLFVGPE